MRFLKELFSKSSLSGARGRASHTYASNRRRPAGCSEEVNPSTSGEGLTPSPHFISKTKELTEHKGFVIGDILIVPSNEKLRNDFFVKYLLHKDANKAISPYINEDMEVWAIDTKHLQDANILFYNKL